MSASALSPLSAHGSSYFLFMAIAALLLGILVPIAAVEAEKRLLPPAGNPRIYTWAGLPNFAVLMAFALILGVTVNLLEIGRGLRVFVMLEFIGVWLAYSKFRGTR